MKILKQGLCLGVVAAGLAAVPMLQTQAGAAPAGDDSLVAQMRKEADGAVAVTREPATDHIGFIHGNQDLMPDTTASNAAQAAAKATAYLDQYAAAFGARPAELEQQRVVGDDLGWTVSFTQHYRGVPVFGSTLKANVDKQGDLTSVTGYTAPDLSLSTDAKMTAAQASARAVQAVQAQPPGDASAGTDLTGLKAADPQLVVYRLGSTRGEAGKALLAWQVVVTNERNVRDMVILSDSTRKPVNRWSMVDSALHRELYEADANRKLTLVWEEGDPLLPDPAATVNEDQDSMVKSTGDSYWVYKNAFDRDSYDGAGHIMRTINNDPAIQCPNANWNGETTNYCDGVSSDDVVSHEWGHAYTEYTSGLIYQWQSGALNESYSDVWGETSDLVNGRLDEGEGDLSAKRPVGLCSSHSPVNPLVTINAPSAIARDCLTGGYLGGSLDTPVTGDVVVPTDAVEPDGGTATDGCSPYTDAAAAAGKIVMVDRGLCTFVEKAQAAKAAGASAVIIGNRDDSPVSFSSPDTTLPPTVSIGLTDREVIRGSVAAGETVNVTIKDASGERVDSYRWLMGEKSEAFGGAIRDMWTPTCYGDPGKVSDAEYKCSTDDHGGVHGNSGVPNHAYALAVDGGTYNGVTVNGIGIDKAANIWWRAQSAYLTPTSDFTDFADALAGSCADLTGQPINKITTTPDSTTPADPVTAADCTSLAAAAQAVELRKEPTQCNFQPLLAKNAPSPCGAGFTNDVLWSEDFESGLDGWGAAVQTTYPAGHGIPWTATSAAPGDHPGGVAYGPAPDAGDCSGGANDISSRDSMISPAISVPSGATASRLSFEHYVATESGFDGGNVKISVNNGPFKPIPSAAYVFNAPNLTLQPAVVNGAAYNTNPMAGEAAFSGTDGGVSNGSWGTSIVDLSKAGVKGPSTVKLRFDVGRDGCGGIDGWYVDNVEVSVCKAATKVAAAHKPEPSKLGEASVVEVTVARDGNTGLPPKGSVTLVDGTTTVGSAKLVSGAASIPVPADYPVGVHAMTVQYSGDSSTAASSAPVTVTIVGATTPHQASTKTKLKVWPKSPHYRDSFVLEATVKGADHQAPTGKVVFKIDGDVVGTATLDSSGEASLKVKKHFRIGRHEATAKYAGSPAHKSSDDQERFKIRW